MENIEIKGLKKSQLYDIIKKFKDAGIDIAKIEININQSFTDCSNNNFELTDNSIYFGDTKFKDTKYDEFISSIAKRYKEISKFFSNRESLNSFLRKYIFIPRTTPAPTCPKISDISLKVIPATPDNNKSK